MCYARRQRSSWARIKLSKKLYLIRFCPSEIFFQSKLIMLNYLFRVSYWLWLSYLYDLKIQKNFRSLCTLVIKIHESCCSIFNELCFSLHHLAARSLFIIPLCLLLVKRFFKLFFKVFSNHLDSLSRSDFLFESFYIISLSLEFVKRFLKLFSKFFVTFSLSLCPHLECLYIISPSSTKVNTFLKSFFHS